MDWLQLIGILGLGTALGTLVTQLVNFFVTHRITEGSERRRWVRDNKLVAFSSLTDELLKFGINQEEYLLTDPLLPHTKLAKVLLLMEDEQLEDRLNGYFVARLRLASLTRQGQFTTEEWSALAEKLLNEAHALVSDLRHNLLHSEPDTPRLSASTQWLIFAGVVAMAAVIIWVVSVFYV